ncbi:ribonuclease H-like protein [Aspergillus sclerotioniger CBS 115572]|uniref:ribonuclease H n=1 Tax=Aspergillus sclerotioniger CBS 115572 TaxID=1450535 RepID=A0A317XAM0_9EURO|nr:ribonuclease H-like protein [Aspergillus sclerotioniger CBS 115572]PWY93570.1 ribonuclease H-like protein [Aspergillus sclerotioniger CBS 115572]
MGSRQASESAPIPPTGILIAVDEDPKPKITALPKRFASPNSASPRRLFKTKVTYSDGHPGLQRFVGVKDSSQCLAYAAGACFENEKDNKPKAGWSFVFRPRAPFAPRGQRSGGISGHLETTGPTGATRTPTSQRAQLRAVIAALRYLNMHGNSFKSVVIATDSPYVVNNATRILPTWLSNGWRNHLGHSVSNRDLWQNLVEVVDSWAKKQKEVYLWRIPRRWNLEADELARLAAASRPVPVDFGELIGRW